MGSKVRNLLIAGIILVLLAGALAFLLLTQQPVSDTSSDIPDSETVDLINRDENDVQSVTVKNELGRFTAKTDKKGNLRISELSDFEPQLDNYNQLKMFGYDLSASQLVDENADDLSKYGLDKPAATAVYQYSDKTEYEIALGNEAPSGDGRYAYTSDKGEKTVYIIADAKCARWLDTKYAYISTDMTSSDLDDMETEDDSDTETLPPINSFTINRKDLDEPIRFVEVTERSDDDQLAMLECIYRLDRPFNATLDSEEGSSPVSLFYGISADTVVGINPTAADMEKYGFDDPEMTLVMDAVDKKYSHTLVVGKGISCEETDDPDTLEEGHEHEITSYYCLLDDDNAVYAVPASSLSWLTLDIKDILSDYVVNPRLNNVDTVTVKLDGKTYEFKVTGEQTVVSDGESSEVTSDTTKVTYNGKQLDVEKFRNYYVFLNGITAEDIVDEQPDETPVMEIRYHYRDSELSDDVVKLIPYGNSRIAVELNGSASIVSRSAFVDRAAENTEKLINGKEINPYW